MENYCLVEAARGGRNESEQIRSAARAPGVLHCPWGRVLVGSLGSNWEAAMPRSALFSAAAAPPSQRVAGRGGANASSSYASSSSPSAAMLMIFGRADGRRGNARDGVLRSGRHATEWCGSAPMRCGSRSRLAVPRAKGGDPLEGGRPSDPTPLPPSKVGVNPRDAKSAGYSSASFSSPPVRVRFKLQYRCHSRQMLAIAGSMAPLGWSFLSIARNPLRWKEGDYWNIEVRHMRACVRACVRASRRRAFDPTQAFPPSDASSSARIACPPHPPILYVCLRFFFPRRTQLDFPVGARVEYKYVVLEDQDWTKQADEESEGLVPLYRPSGNVLEPDTEAIVRKMAIVAWQPGPNLVFTIPSGAEGPAGDDGEAGAIVEKLDLWK